jgi:hypothetical protein
MKKMIGGRDRNEWWQLVLAYLDAGFEVEFSASGGDRYVGEQRWTLKANPSNRRMDAETTKSMLAIADQFGVSDRTQVIGGVRIDIQKPEIKIPAPGR